VVAALQEKARADLAEITVRATDGIVILAGRVRTHPEKWSIVHVAERVAGVSAIADEIYVDLHRDEEIAQMILDRLRASAFPDGRKGGGCSLGDPFKIHVQRGWVILKGTAQSKRQRAKLEEIVRVVRGVRGVSNRLKIKEVAIQRHNGKTATKPSFDPHSGQEDGAATPAAGILDRAR
jgi:hypothetical protein